MESEYLLVLLWVKIQVAVRLACTVLVNFVAHFLFKTLWTVHHTNAYSMAP
jgi:hypothetical protein